jgi:hypothetical protein
MPLNLISQPPHEFLTIFINDFLVDLYSLNRKIIISIKLMS